MTHGNGDTGLYGHRIRWPSTWSGRWVGQNWIIGYCGSTGNATGPHVRYAIKRWGVRYASPHIGFGKWVNRGWWCASYDGI